MQVVNPADAAVAATGGDWRSGLHPEARTVMVKKIMMSLRKNLPLAGSEGLSRLQSIADGFENKFYTTATCQSSYSRKLAMLLLHVEKPNQNSHCQAPGLPPQGNNPAVSSTVSLISQQQTQTQNTSTSVQACSLPSLSQSLTGIGQTSTQNMSGQSTSPQIMQLMVMQSATQGGIQQNPLNIVQQPMQSLCQQPPQCVERRQQHPQLYLHQQPSLQQTQLTQEPSIPLQQQPQQLMGLQPNLHQNQLICQQSSPVDMQQQHRLSVQSNNLLNPQHPVPDNVDLSMPHINTGDFYDLGDHILSDEVLGALGPLEDPYPLSPLHGIQGAKGLDQLDTEQVAGAAILFPPSSDTQMQNDWLCSSRLVAMEDPNNVSMVDSATNLKKRKFDGSSSSTPVFGQATSTPVDDHTSAPAPPCPAIPRGASTTPPWEFQGWMPSEF